MEGAGRSEGGGGLLSRRSPARFDGGGLEGVDGVTRVSESVAGEGVDGGDGLVELGVPRDARQALG